VTVGLSQEMCRFDADTFSRFIGRLWSDTDATDADDSSVELREIAESRVVGYATKN